LVIDLGVGTYTQKTFSDRRYEIWTMQSQFHNLPTFIDEMGNIDELGNDAAKDVYNKAYVMEHDGEKYSAGYVNCILCSNLDYNSDKCVSSLSMDIADAYGDERIRSYKRTVSLIKGQGVCIEDSYDGDLKAVVSLMTYDKPEIEVISTSESCEKFGEAKILVRIGNLGFAEITGAESATVKAYPVTDERLSIAWKHEVYRVLFELGHCNKLEMKFR